MQIIILRIREGLRGSSWFRPKPDVNDIEYQFLNSFESFRQFGILVGFSGPEMNWMTSGRILDN